MRYIGKRWVWGVGVAVVLVFATFWFTNRLLRSPLRGVIPDDHFLPTKNLDNWQSFGGTWTVEDGTVRNDSDERGAKILTGSPYWKDYSLEADIKLLGEDGDVGLIVRSSEEEAGVDSYHGYYAGLRAQETRIAVDNRLDLGKADHQWIELTSILVPNGVVPLRWYHLKILVYGCQIAAAATYPLNSGRTVTVSFTDPQCISRGRAGLRSYGSGGAWRNIRVKPANATDLADMLAVPAPSNSAAALAEGRANNPGFGSSSPDISTIRQLRLMPVDGEALATVRGVVISTAPRLYIQDSTGGAAVYGAANTALKIGDEVQVTGKVDPGRFSPVLHDSSIRVLWTSPPLAPMFVTASQASTGFFNATFVEVTGYLQSWERAPDHVFVLHLSAGTQTFQARLYGEQMAPLVERLRPRSLITVRGICVVDSAYTRNITPFAVLLRSTEDLNVLKGPPWWSPRNIIILFVAVFVLVILVFYIQTRIERWRIGAVLAERERIAHEMHDTLAQSFAGIGFQLEALRNQLSLDKRNHEHLNLARELVRHSHEEARRNIASLRPESLIALGLIEALERCATRLIAGGEIQFHSFANGDPHRLPPALADTFFRIGQEALANAIRHARASLIEVHLQFNKKTVEFVIEDDGIGFDPQSTKHGFGLEGMRKRAAVIGAEFNLITRQGCGTKIVVLADLPQRLTFKALSTHLWKYCKESIFHERKSGTSDSHTHR